MGRINLIRFVKACKGSGGLISIVAKRLDVARQSVYDYLQREPKAVKYLDEAKEEILDMAESKLINSMNSNDLESIKWYLARLGRKRGYIANPEVQVIGKQNNLIVGNIHELIEQAKNKTWKSQNQISTS